MCWPATPFMLKRPPESPPSVATMVLAGLRLQLAPLMEAARGDRPGEVAFHSPCSLQHGLGSAGPLRIARQLRIYSGSGGGFSPCCGSAGYSILQPEISKRLRDNELNALNTGSPQFIATANIGCLGHLQAGSDLPVRHWVELVDEVSHECRDRQTDSGIRGRAQSDRGRGGQSEASPGRGVNIPRNPGFSMELRQHLMRKGIRPAGPGAGDQWDPGLSAMLFKVVGSAVYKQHQPFASVEETSMP